MQKTSTLFNYVFLFFITISYGQNKQIRAYDLDDGLPQSQVYDIIQDSKGYLWLGTQGGGIARFDGKEFETWNERKGLISNYINALQYHKNQLYIGTKQGLSVKQKNRFTNYKSPQINDIIVYKNTIYLATNKGLYSFKNYTLRKENVLNNANINALKIHQNTFWIATNNGLWKISADFKTKQKLSPFNFKSIETYNDTVFCASFMNGILAFNNKTQNIRFLNEIKRINAINLIDNELWIATDNKGILVIDVTDYQIIQTINKKTNLPISHIRKTIQDKQLNIWVASSGGGIFKISENNFTHFNKNNGLKGNRIYAINAFEDAVCFSHSEEGVSKIDSLGIHFITQDSSFLNVKVKTLAHDNKGNLYCGTDGKGILLMHNSKKDSIITRLNDENRIVRDSIRFNYQFADTLSIDKNNAVKWIRKIITDKNDVWVASYSSGISKFNYNNSTRKIENLIHFKTKNGILDLLINDLAIDSNGTLWYATKKGHLGTIKNNKVTHFGNVLKKNTSIRTLLFHDNNLYIATSGKGIWWSNLSEPLSFNKLSGKKNLYSDNIYQLIFDADNNLWAGSENGVDRITLSDDTIIQEIRHFGRNEGFLGIETCLNSVAKDSNNNLWFGTIHGLTKYQGNSTKVKKQKPTLFIENIEVMNKSLDTLLITNFTENKAYFKLKFNQNLLGFSFKSVDLNNPKELKYRWKIDDSNWSPWHTDTKVNIASNYGNHTFYAQSRNLSWLKSDVASFQFNREKPLHLKSWFQWLIIGLTALLILVITRHYFRKIKLKNEQDKNRLQLENDLLSLEQKALRLQMNPHFIFNVLNGIKAMSINDTKTMHTTINKFATLLRATLSNSRKDNITLKEEINTLKNYIDVEQLMSVKPFTYQINSTVKLDAEEILIPPMLIQPFIENAIKHGITPLQKNGHLEISFTVDEHFLNCTITDNGIGINQSINDKKKSNHQSMALEVTKERIEHLSGKNTMNVIDLSDNDTKKTGTKVQFKIPLLTDY